MKTSDPGLETEKEVLAIGRGDPGPELQYLRAQNDGPIAKNLDSSKKRKSGTLKPAEEGMESERGGKWVLQEHALSSGGMGKKRVNRIEKDALIEVDLRGRGDNQLCETM